MPPFPPGAIAGGNYLVTEADVTIAVPHLLLPDRFTITLDPNVRALSWIVGTLEFGEDCTFDLSAYQTPLPKAPPGGRPPGQPGYGEKGRAGRDGRDGSVGAAGRALDLTIGRVVEGGSFWIRTDGAPGQEGGNGGRGGIGGGSACWRPDWNGATDGGKGGNGGTGGDGGRGGDTSKIILRLASDIDRIPQAPPADTDQVAPSTRPPSATGDTGVIVIWGAPGSGGAPGTGGPGGKGGTRNRDCQWPIRDVKSGRKGKKGANGSRGKKGSVARVEIDRSGDFVSALIKFPAPV